MLQEEDDFGMKDSDWDVYKKIARDAEDSDSEEESLKAQVGILHQINYLFSSVLWFRIKKMRIWEKF